MIDIVTLNFIFCLIHSGVQAPTLRPSLRQALQPDAIEEVVLRCVINHLRLTKTVHGLELLQATKTEGEEYRHLCGVMKDVFSRLNGLIRQLQSMAEMEQKWAHELDDVREGILQPSAAFFNDFHLQEVHSFVIKGTHSWHFELPWPRIKLLT